MKNHATTGDRARDGFGVREITAEDLELADHFGVAGLQPAVVAARGVADECTNRGARTDERFREVTADEPARARDENAATDPRFRLFCASRRHSGNLLRMRLLVCVPWYAPARGFGGGIVTSLMATVEGALEAGHEVTVATTDLLDPQSRIPPDTPTELAGAQVLR